MTDDFITEDTQFLLPSHPVEGPVVLHGLEVLHTEFSKDVPRSDLLWDRISLPSLVYFHADIRELRGPFEKAPILRSFYSCLERSRPPLVQFEASLYFITTEARQFIEMLSWMPALKTLKIILPYGKAVVNEAFWWAIRGEHNLAYSRAIEIIPVGRIRWI